MKILDTFMLLSGRGKKRIFIHKIKNKEGKRIQGDADIVVAVCNTSKTYLLKG